MSANVAGMLAVGHETGKFLFESIRSTLSSGPQRSETIIFALSVLAVVLLIVLSARFLSRETKQSDKPQVDYLTLAVDLLELSEADRRLLVRIAQAAKLDQPAAMLLSPANLAAAARALTGGSGGSRLLAEVDDLCARLFDCPLPAGQGDDRTGQGPGAPVRSV